MGTKKNNKIFNTFKLIKFNFKNKTVFIFPICKQKTFN